MCVYARVKRVPVRRLRGGAEIAPGVCRTARPCVCTSGGFPAVSRRLSGCLALPVSVAPACRWLLPCVLTEKRDNFGFVFGIKSLFLWLCFWLQTGIFFWKLPESARRVGFPARSDRLVSGQGVRARRQGGKTPRRRRTPSPGAAKKKSELFA